MPTLHVHFDESGDMSFTPRSGTYFVLTVAWTYDPQPLATALTALRFGLCGRGQDCDSFHASPDHQDVRDAVVQTMLSHTDWGFAAIVLEKRKVNPVLRPPERFYPFFAGSLLKFVFRGSAYRRGTSRVLVYADTIPMRTNAQREGVLKAIKQTCSRELAAGIPHHVFSHCRQSNKWLQVVDYCCWAVATKWERAELRTYNQLLPRLARTELNVTAGGDQTEYY
jgi:hypothetical protein